MIISDRSGTFEAGTTLTQVGFLSRYFRVRPDDEYNGYYESIPMPSAIGMIAGALGIEYRYVS